MQNPPRFLMANTLVHQERADYVGLSGAFERSQDFFQSAICVNLFYRYMPEWL